MYFLFMHQGRSEHFKYNKWVIRSRKSKKERQYNGQKKEDKRTNNDLEKASQKAKNGATRIPRYTDKQI